MKLSGDTITTANTVAVFHALATASEKARRIMRLAEDSDIHPADAASRINALLSTLNLALAEVADPAPPVPAELKRDLVLLPALKRLVAAFEGTSIPEVDLALAAAESAIEGAGKPKPEPGFRYFGSPDCFWKIPPTGKGFVRGSGQQWRKSTCDISDLIECEQLEVTAEEAEP